MNYSSQARLVLLFSTAICIAAMADDTKPEKIKKYEDMSIEELMNVPVSVASGKATTVGLSPGIVTLITGDEIRHSGARDLVDVLQMVPGLSFASTGQGN